MTNENKENAREHRKALDMSQEFFEEIALPSLRETFPQEWDRIGAGLVGNGSECLGFDDELSRDHDWGIEFFIWLADEDFDRIGDDVRRWKAALWEAHPEQPTEAAKPTEAAPAATDPVEEVPATKPDNGGAIELPIIPIT